MSRAWHILALPLLLAASACSKENAPTPSAPEPAAARANDTDAPESEAPVSGVEGDSDEIIEASTAPRGPRGSAGLIAEASRILEAMTATSYSHETHVHGTVYDVDCSGFVDYLLLRVDPAAFAELRAATVARPLAKHFVLALSSGSLGPNWQRLPRVSDLLPGDVVAWEKPADVTSTNTGHVMIVSSPPEARSDASWAIAIIDSSAAPHGKADARKRAHTTGIGRGVIVLEADSVGAPIAYHWSDTQRSPRHDTKIALGRAL